MEVALIISTLLALGALIAWSRAKTQVTNAREALARAETERDAHAKSVDREVEERTRAEAQRDDLQAKLSESEAQRKAAVAERDTERKNHEQRLQELDERFKGLAADIFKSNSEEFRKLDLTRFSGQLISFRERSPKWEEKDHIQQPFVSKWSLWSDPVAVPTI